MIERIIPEKDLSRILKRVENPGRYVGGEFGLRIKSDAVLRVGVCFPDLYEIGMSNQAIATLYGIVYQTEGATAERVFCPAPDFEVALREANIPLYGLEEGTPLSAFHLLTITLSYELSATNVLLLLQSGGVPLFHKDRKEKDPIVLGGGPAFTNPAPLGEFFDGVFIGEAEEEFATLLSTLVSMKRRGAKREDLLATIRECPSVWYSGKKEKTHRALCRNFSHTPSFSRWFPVPNLKTAHDHGVVEIMRGCPNGCRFCHAGIFYRPFRMKRASLIEEEVAWEVEQKGYREISLSSLSSGDYRGVSTILKKLNQRFRNRYVSFSLPSLHLETFGLELLTDISEVRKSGLTFAVETPNPLWQASLNKNVEKEKVIQVLQEAKGKGWKLAKFYFMVGLPFHEPVREAEEILEFIHEIHRATGIQIHLNVGTFVPKPHTPFQWAGQLTEEGALQSIMAIRKGVRSLPVKVGYQAPFLSVLEGLISRGDERVGEVILKAFVKGARFDAWEDRIQRPAWDEVMQEVSWDVRSFAASSRSLDSPLPWDRIDLGVSPAFLKREWERAFQQQGTPPCDLSCQHPCGVCSKNLRPVIQELHQDLESSRTPDRPDVLPLSNAFERRRFYRYILSYEKVGKAAYIPHLSLLRIFERTVQRAGLHPRFTEGFNPKPYIDFAQPLSLGFSGLKEILSLELLGELPDEELIDRLNRFLPNGLKINQCFHITYEETKKKPVSIMSCFGGGRYRIEAIGSSSRDSSRIKEYFSSCMNKHTELKRIYEDQMRKEERMVRKEERVMKESAELGSIEPSSLLKGAISISGSISISLDIPSERQSLIKDFYQDLLSTVDASVVRLHCVGKDHSSELFEYLKNVYK